MGGEELQALVRGILLALSLVLLGSAAWFDRRPRRLWLCGLGAVVMVGFFTGELLISPLEHPLVYIFFGWLEATLLLTMIGLWITDRRDQAAPRAEPQIVVRMIRQNADMALDDAADDPDYRSIDDPSNPPTVH